LHFTANGFKKQRDLELERRYLPVRYRKRAEYIPLPSEIGRMVTAGRTPSEKAPGHLRLRERAEDLDR
jgi:hypothetical protein